MLQAARPCAIVDVQNMGTAIVNCGGFPFNHRLHSDRWATTH